MMMDRSRALQPVYFAMFQLSILVRMWGNLQYGMPARAGHGVSRIWKALQRALALPVVKHPQTSADGMVRPEADGITDQPDSPSFTNTRGLTSWIARPPSQRARELAGKPTSAVRAAVDDTGRRIHDDGSVAVNDRLTLTRVSASRAHLHSQASREPLDRDHPRAQALLDSGHRFEDYADTLVRLAAAKGQPFRATQATLTKDDPVLLGLSA